jgi:hypothetical protein
LVWTAGFLAFPVAGLAGTAVAGRIDGPLAALGGGAVCGLVIGTGARLVSMENVYMYGRPAGRPLTEDRTYDARTKKGQLRGRMARDLLAAHNSGRVPVAIGRASDYFGPGGGAQSNLGDRVIPAALNGKTATVLGAPDQPHTYTYIPDIGEGLVVLGEHPDAPGQVWHLPNDPETRSTRQMVLPPPLRPTSNVSRTRFHSEGGSHEPESRSSAH